MTIRVSAERSTLSLPFDRMRSGPAPSATASPGRSNGAPAVAAAKAPGEAASLRAASVQLDRATSVADAAQAAMTSVTKLLEQMRDLAAAARQSGADVASDFRDLGGALAAVVAGAGFDGVNLLDGSQGSGAFRVSAGEETGELALRAADLRPGGPIVSVSAGDDPAASLETLGGALSGVSDAQARLGEDAKRVEAHRGFLARLAEADAEDAAVSIGVEGARLAALQLKQSLGGQGFAIANQAPQTVLSLFR